jgi:hypothetical protein
MKPPASRNAFVLLQGISAIFHVITVISPLIRQNDRWRKSALYKAFSRRNLLFARQFFREIVINDK